MDAIECIKTRRSVRSFKPDKIDPAIIADIVDCGRLAATAINIQPWAFVVITDPGTRSAIAELADHGKFIADAPCCIAVFCKIGKYYLEDGAAATQNILLGARAHELGSCWVAGDKKPYCAQVRELVRVPEDYTLVSLVALGKTAHPPCTPKRSLAEVLHWEEF